MKFARPTDHSRREGHQERGHFLKRKDVVIPMGREKKRMRRSRGRVVGGEHTSGRRPGLGWWEIS
jgi:hypothetical protein